ncbi:MAG TPA: putative holin [Mycobacterium sp.]|nr:putative holin [Mycobacterium sp.]
MIPLPRAWQLTAAMLVGTAVGMVAAIAATLLVDGTIRPDVVVALVIGIPCGLGILLILLSAKRWMTTLGAFLLAVGPGWFGVLVAIQAVSYG